MSTTPMEARFRASRYLLASFAEDELRISDTLSGESYGTDLTTFQLLHACRAWSTPRQISEAVGLDTTDEDLLEALEALTAAGLVERESDQHILAESFTWQSWGPEAAAFHFGTKDAPYIELRPDEEAYVEDILEGPQPALFKTYADTGGHIYLPRPGRNPRPVSYWDILEQRRTTRDFTDEPLTFELLGELLHAAIAPRHFIDAGPFGALAMRPFATAGARGELEAYVVPLRVDGVSRAVYHYEPVSHRLERVNQQVDKNSIDHLTYMQSMCSDACVVVFITAVLERMSRKYRHPRALRAVLLDAGHLGQTFAMTGTALGLGVAQTAAFRDSDVEALLGIDGVNETALYCLSVGVAAPPEQSEQTLPASLQTNELTTMFHEGETP